MKTLYGEIFSRAKAVYSINKDEDYVDPVLWDKWVKTWFDAAEQLRQEMIDNGLLVTAEAVAKIIEDQRKFL